MRATAAAVAVALLLTACGKDGPSSSAPADPGGGGVVLGVGGDQPEAAQELGFPGFATKNTTRVAGADPVADAAGVAQAVFPGGVPAARPPAVVLADEGDWQAAVAGAVLMARPVRAPMLLARDGDLPEATAAALRRLDPTGSGVLGRAQVIRIGDEVPQPDGLQATTVAGGDPFELAAAIDRIATTAAGEPSDQVVVAGAHEPAYAMPAAAWAAKSGDPVLFVERDAVPEATAAALRRHEQPQILVLGGPGQVSDAVVEQLGELGAVTRIGGATPQHVAVSFARFAGGAGGWGVVDPGHGLVFANPGQPAAAGAAAPLSSSGSYGPLLLTGDDGSLPNVVVQYLLDIQPGYQSDPVRGVYNHGWLIGDEQAITLATQSRIDALLEISPVNDEAP
ncbi:MAG TPA: cell wall-binding repeat-containing protein [Capillimicrobium sp.]|nr:cell wall-binding repeat-containing protein [Capillimicrobium sp.]